MAYEAPQFGDAYDPQERLLPAEEEMPFVDMLVGKENYHMTWRDTLVRTFSVGNGEYDHVLHDYKQDGSIYMFFSQMSDDTGGELKSLLETHEFPHRRDPILDDETIDLFSRMEIQTIDSTIDAIIQKGQAGPGKQ
jgi:hypothetical protein